MIRRTSGAGHDSDRRLRPPVLFLCSGRNTSYTAGQSVMLEPKKAESRSTRDSLGEGRIYSRFAMAEAKRNFQQFLNCLLCGERGHALADRKRTRLNSRHQTISYTVFFF